MIGRLGFDRANRGDLGRDVLSDEAANAVWVCPVDVTVEIVEVIR